MTKNKTLDEARNERCRMHRKDRYVKRQDREHAIAWKYGKALPSLAQVIAEHFEYDSTCSLCLRYGHNESFCPTFVNSEGSSFDDFYNSLYDKVRVPVFGSYFNGLLLELDSQTGTASCGFSDEDFEDRMRLPYDYWDDEYSIDPMDRYYMDMYAAEDLEFLEMSVPRFNR